MSATEIEMIRTRCDQCPPPDPEMDEIGAPTWCADCEGTGQVYFLDSPSVYDTLLALAQMLDTFADDNTIGQNPDTAVRMMAAGLRDLRDDLACDAAERRDEDAMWRAGCG